MPLRVSADHSETLWPASSRAWEIPIRVTIPNPCVLVAKTLRRHIAATAAFLSESVDASGEMMANKTAPSSMKHSNARSSDDAKSISPARFFNGVIGIARELYSHF
jgi:hypothetical protein